MTRPLRIAMFVGCFPVVSETFILRQITGLMDLGHTVRIFSNQRPDDAAPIQPGVIKYGLLQPTVYVTGPPESVVWEMPVSPLGGKTWPPGASKPVSNYFRLLHALPRLLRCLPVAPRLTLRALQRAEYRYQAASLSMLYRLATLCSAGGHYDVLHAHFGPVANSFRFARDLWKAPLVVSFHGYDFSTLPRQEGPDLYHRLFANVDCVTVNSDHTRQQVVRLGCPLARIRKLPVGLDLEEFPCLERVRATGEPVQALTVGRLVGKKGLEYSIRAVAQVRRRHPSLRYDIIGDGPLRQALSTLIAELGQQDCIVLHGARDVDFVRQKMCDAHLFLLASVTAADGDQEGQGLALQEAQACGLPVLATTHAAFPEGVLPGQSGFLVPERDVDALAERLTFLVEHPEEWGRLGRAGHAFVAERYDIHHLNRALVAIYEEAVQEYGQTV